MSSRYIPQDRRAASSFDANGRRQERLSEYFDFRAFPDKASMKVTRNELLVILTTQWRREMESRWYRRLWRWLMVQITPKKPVPNEPAAEAQP